MHDSITAKVNILNACHQRGAQFIILISIKTKEKRIYTNFEVEIKYWNSMRAMTMIHRMKSSRNKNNNNKKIIINITDGRTICVHNTNFTSLSLNFISFSFTFSSCVFFFSFCLVFGVHFNYRCSVCVCERFLVTKRWPRGARHDRTEKKVLYDHSSRQTINTQPNGWPSLLFSMFFSFFFCFVSPFLFLSCVGSCLPLRFVHFIFILLCWYFLQHNSLVLQFFFFVCYADVYDYIWWVGDHRE